MATYVTLPSRKIQAKVRRNGHKAVTRTFTTKRDAELWAQSIEKDMHQGSFIDVREAKGMPLATLIDWYQKTIVPSHRSGATDVFRLNTIRQYFDGRSVASISPQDAVDFVEARLALGRKANTIRREVHQLSDLFRKGMAFKFILLPTNPITDGIMMIRALRKLPKGNARERRLCEGELAALMAVPHRPSNKLTDLIQFAILAPMRAGEIAAMRWNLVDFKRGVYRIPHTKTDHITGKTGRDMPLLPEALKILEALRQEQNSNVVAINNDSSVWGYLNGGTISKAFTELCKAANIKDLHFHDLRHEGTSRLFERGYSIQEVAMFTGHTTWESLKRYTQLDASKLARLARG